MKKLAIIGAGSMSEALIGGMVQKKFIKGEQIFITNRSNQTRLDELKVRYGVQTSYEYHELLNGADMVVLAMKPKDVASSMEKLKHFLKPNMLIVSVLAGVSISSLEALAERKLAIIRAMPNTSAAVGLSATALALGTEVTDDQKRFAQMMFNTVGLTAFVEEHQLDAVTGLSGSGPAYIYFLVEAMEKSAVEIGLEPTIAKDLIVQTLLGAAEMLATSTKTPEQLRQAVTSPGGTTEAGLKVLASYQVQEAFIECIKEASAQSERLGQNLTKELSKIKRTS